MCLTKRKSKGKLIMYDFNLGDIIILIVTRSNVKDNTSYRSLDGSTVAVTSAA